MASDRDTASILAPPPILFAACLLLGWMLSAIWPFDPLQLNFQVGLTLGCILLLAALVISIPALVVMHRNHTPAEPWKPTVRIVTTGPFRFSRNPLYVGLMLVQAGIAVMLGWGWLLVLVPVLFLLLDRGVVRGEERYLSERFGEDYREYLRKVRRWM